MFLIFNSGGLVRLPSVPFSFLSVLPQCCLPLLEIYQYYISHDFWNLRYYSDDDQGDLAAADDDGRDRHVMVLSFFSGCDWSDVLLHVTFEGCFLCPISLRIFHHGIALWYHI